MRTHAVTSGVVEAAASPFFQAYCFSTDAVGDLVYIMGPKLGVYYQVAKVDIDDPAKMPAVGVIIAKVSPTECVVQTDGIVRGFYSGLVTGRPAFAGIDARATTTFVRPTSGYRLLQIVGVSLSSMDLLLGLQMPSGILPP
jgi:hypothetical protein